MKGIVSLIISLLSCMSMSAQTVKEYFSVGNPIQYCETDFYLAWSAHPQDIYYVQEYLPQGESLEHYNQMLTVSVVFWNRTPHEAVQAKIAELEQRKKTDPVTNYMVVENDGGEYILEFIVSDSNNGELSTVEVDVHHYRQMSIDGRDASVLVFYSCRAYDDIEAFIKAIPQNRASWYECMSHLDLTPVFP